MEINTSQLMILIGEMTVELCMVKQQLIQTHAENEQLKAKLAELEKQLEDAKPKPERS